MKLSNFSKLSFGIGALGKDLCYAIISYFLMIYFTDTIGLTPLFVGNPVSYTHLRAHET